MSAGDSGLVAQIDPASMARFAGAMDNLNTILGKRQKSIVEVAAVKLVTALGSAEGTAIAKNRREIIENPEWFQARNDVVMAGGSNSKASRTAKKNRWKIPKYAALFNFKTPKGGKSLATGGGYFPIIGPTTISEARSYPIVQIKDLGAGGYRGIARKSWAWTLKALGKPAQNERQGATDSYLTQDRNGNGFDAVWTGINRVGYERKALRRPIAASVNAATEMMIKQAERETVKARGEVGFR